MIGPLRLSYGNARLRARKSRLRSVWEARRLRSIPGLAPFAEALGLSSVTGEAELERALFDRLLDDYARVLEDYAPGRPLVRALLARHEIENLKLGWRAVTRRLPADRWAGLWRDFGRLETVPPEIWTGASSLADAVRDTAKTPFGSIARETLEAHAGDEAAAELALDRFAFAKIAEEAERLPPREMAARRIALSLVYERDFDAFRRSIAFSGLSPELAGAASVRLRDVLPKDALRDLAAWTSGPLPFERRLFAGILPPDRAIPDWDALRMAIRRERVAACRRAFAGPPFRIGPAVAFLVLREAETRALAALASSLPSPSAAATPAEPADHAPNLSAALERTVAASLLGA